MKQRYWIVRHRDNSPASLSDYGDGVMVLTIGGTVALFKSYDAARSAIKRTVRYAVAHNYNAWDADKCRITRAEAVR